VHVFKGPRYILPAPSAVWEGFMSQPGRMLSNTWTTVQIIVVGYAIAVLVSIPLALLSPSRASCRPRSTPAWSWFQIIPKIAVAPLFIVWFGFGSCRSDARVPAVFFPIVISAIAGFRSLDADVETSRARPARRVAHVLQDPAAQSLPSIFTGLKVGAAMAPPRRWVASSSARTPGSAT